MPFLTILLTPTKWSLRLQWEVPDMMPTRYTCYLIARNGRPRKEKIAFKNLSIRVM